MLLAVLWVAPLDAWLPAFPVHMLRHMGLVAVAAPLIVLAFPGPAQKIAVPPFAAAAVEFAVVWAWHVPVAHAFARTGGTAYVLEQAGFLAVGTAVWAGCLRAGNALTGAAGLLVTSMHMTLLGALLVLAPRDLYSEVCGTQPDLPAQQLGGMLMLAIGTPIYLAGGLILTARSLKESPA